ncbi:MAG: right-handed parallel beta-helix repeat-containing protein [Acidobacteriales bacterium]|nr:right-handed parallel beta-helix repeat-containing protein [Terriglobales bacterium]
MRSRWWAGLFLCLVIASGLATATTYYVDATGGLDGNDGLSVATAWKTVAKVNSASLVPGDQVLFKRGEIWRESLVPGSSGTSGNPVVFDAYGTGEPPTLTGYLDLPASSWTLDSGNIWKAAVTATSMAYVMFGSEWGYKQTSGKSACVNPRDFYFYANTLYVFSQGNPAAVYGSVAAMLQAYGQMVYVNGKSWLTFQHLRLTYFDSYGLRIGGASDHITVANVTADGIIPTGAQPHGFYVSASPSPGDINFYNDEANRNYDGFRFAGSATGIKLENCKGYANRDKGLQDDTGAATYSYCHFYANGLGVFQSTDTQGGIAGPGNIAQDTWPAVTGFNMYPARITTTVDDVGLAQGTDTYINSLLPQYDARGLKMSMAVTAGYASSVVGQVSSWLAAGHDINSHSWSHQYYTNTNAFSIQYTGTGTAATFTISGNRLTTTITGGPGGEALSLDLTSSSYDSMSELVATITAMRDMRQCCTRTVKARRTRSHWRT